MGSVYCVPIQSLNPSIVAAGRPRSPRTYQSSRDAVLIATSLTSLVLDFAARHEVAGDVGKTGASLVVGPAVATVAKKDRKLRFPFAYHLLITRGTDSKRHRHAPKNLVG